MPKHSFIHSYFPLLLFIPSILLLLLSGCEKEVKKDEPDLPIEISVPLNPSQRTILIYAVASNDLYTNWLDDQQEILNVAHSISGLGSDIQILLYSVIPGDEYGHLTLLVNEKEGWNIHELKTYDREIFSTDPKRISDVIADVKEISPSENYGLIFWSHATGWTPFQSPNHTVKRAYGLDKYQGVADQCDITELADAIPAGMFDFIWFDCCYMGSVELAYELAPKIDYMVGYPSEVWSEGLPYNQILPYLAVESPDLEGAAEEVSKYFETHNLAYSIGFYDLTSSLNALPIIFKEILETESNTSPSEAQKYSRKPYGPFYDLVDLGKILTESDDNELGQKLETEVSKIVKYRNCSYRSFLGSWWYPERCSGITVHYPGDADTSAEEYYAKTRWGKAVLFGEIN